MTEYGQPAHARSSSTMDSIKDFLGGVVVVVFGLFWAFGGLIGAIIEATREDLVGVVLAIMIPGYGALVTLLALFRALF